MSFKTKLLIVGAGLLALGACGEAGSKSWNSEAGSYIDEGGFGNPTMNNMLAQMCRGRAKGYIVPDAIVALDPQSPKSAPVYRQGKVMCSGELNGKYAQVIWGGYIRSAVPPTSLGSGLGEISGEG